MDFYETKDGGVRGGRIALTVLAAIVTLAFAAPIWNVWAARLSGEAELAHATANRKILVQEAEAKKEAAKLLGEAEVARAHSLAEANHIVGNSLGGPENYIRYLWIQQIDKVSAQVIYVPTETGLPLTEATRLQRLPHSVLNASPER